MSSGRHERVKEVFFEASRLGGAAREAYLLEACRDDPAMREEIESLLAYHRTDADPEPESTASLTYGDTNPDPGPEGAAAGDEGVLLAGRYAVAEELGRGGLGRVYRAFDRKFDRWVALKAVRITSPALAGVFKSEARLLNSLRHRALPVVTDYFADGDLYYLVMDFVPGEDLAAMLRHRRRRGEGPFPAEAVLRWCDQLLEALEYLAAQEPPVVHRDIKPQNLKLSPRGEIVLLDFGLAKGSDGDRSVAGYTPRYAPLEQIRGLGTDARSDLFSLAVTAVELLFGAPPPDAVSRAEALVAGRPDPLRAALDFGPDVPAHAARALAAALALPREDRPGSAAALRAMLAGGAPAPRRPAPPGREEAPAGNLPRPVASFVGRSEELGLLRGDVRPRRLVTLTGAGGVGKTRLAVEAARELAGEYPDGVWFVDLAPRGADAAARAAADALGVRVDPAGDAASAVADFLRDRRLLLVLDNCEHVLGATAALAARVLEAAPGVAVLATSREPLGVAGEIRRAVEPLALPAGAGRLDELLEFDAVRLFVARAREARAGFTPEPARAATLASVCRRLDGIPLALELAAARVKVLSLEQIDRRLADRFGLLAGGSRSTPARHQTLRAAIDWSYDLLDPAERAALAALSIFPAGCGPEAAEAACGDAAGDVLDTLSRLADRSLVRVHEERGEARYRLFEAVREYALEKLRASGEEARAAGGLRRWALELARAAALGFKGADQAEWVARTAAEEENLREALRRSLEGAPPGDEALELASGLGAFWLITGRTAEGCAWLERALGACAGAGPRLVAEAHVLAGALANARADYGRACDHYERALAAARAAGDTTLAGRALTNLGRSRYEQGRTEEAIALMEEGLEIFRSAGDARLESIALLNLGVFTHNVRSPREAVPYYERALELKRAAGDRMGVATALLNLGKACEQPAGYARAREMLEEAAAIFAEVGQRKGLSDALQNLAEIELANGRPDRCGELLARSLAHRREIGDARGVAESLEEFAKLRGERGEWDVAVRLVGAARAARERLGMAISPFDEAQLARCLGRAAASLGEAAVERLLAEGRSLSVDAAASLSLDAGS